MADEIEKLKQDIGLNNVMIFIGTGVSFYTTNGEEEVSHWKGLLKHGFEQCHQSGWIDNKDFEDFSDKLKNNTGELNDYLLVANQIKDCLKRRSNGKQGDIYKIWLRETFEKLSPKNPELIKAIGELECPIITTNYDLLLEDILKKKRLLWNNYYIDNNINSNEDLTNSILHLYGYYDESDSIIFSSHDYKRIRRNHFGQTKLRKLIKRKTLLFIGYDSEIFDPHFSNLLKWIYEIKQEESISIYKLVKSTKNNNFHQTFEDISFSENIKQIQYGNIFEDLISFITDLQSFTPLIRENLLFINKKQIIQNKYLNYLIKEYGHISIFGHSNNHINLPLESIYVELKFDPIHPSIKAMKTFEINEEFKRKLLSPGFFNDNERKQLNRAIIERNSYYPETIYRDFMIDQWLNVLLNNKNIFTDNQATTIKNKIHRLKQNIIEKNNFKDSTQYQIQQAYYQFKHFIILGHPGSGKTTLSKWLVMNMAKQCLGIKNILFNNNYLINAKIPILIPIWKYVDQSKQYSNQQKKTLLQFISENPIFNSTFFNNEEQKDLSSFIKCSLIQGNVLIIFEGLDEVPAHIDRNDLIKEINTLLERGIDYDVKSNQIIYSIYEQKQINSIKDPNIGNRFIITSRIEGNYFEDINFFIPRLTIENMSNDALKLFCNSYMKCIQSERFLEESKFNQLYNHITENKDIFQLAINPQLASVIAAIYNQYEEKLPEKRIDLYEKAIEMMIQRLISSTNYLQLNATILWTIMQEIAEYLHSKVEGLSENILKEIIRKCLIHDKDDLISKLVNIFKYQAGLLSEFGHDSFRFLHRTFQEYLAAKSIIYSYGIQRSEDIIYNNIINKIDIPNWRVPLYMTFGILSKLSSEQNQLFNHIIQRLISSNTLLIPFILIDSLNDIDFSSKHIEYDLINKLLNMLLFNYKNISGFSRLKEHQQLIHSYFIKLKYKYNYIIIQWFIEKINHDENNLAPCANIIYHMKFYQPKFHQIFLNNLHHDSIIWNWPIDSLLRFYSNHIDDENILIELKFKNTIKNNQEIFQYITKNNDWLSLIIALYGGFQYYNTPSTISEYYELCQFLSLSDKQRLPFTFYYQDVWGRDDTAYNMAVHADKLENTKNWNNKPMFDINQIYKESFLTTKLIELLHEKKSTIELRQELREQLNSEKLNTSEKVEAAIALVALGEFDFINAFISEQEQKFLTSFEHRIEQLISILKDPIARWSSHMSKYLHMIYNNIRTNQLKYNLHFSDYCKIYLSLTVNSGGLPIHTRILANIMDNPDDKYYLYAEYFAFQFTGANRGDIQYNILDILEKHVKQLKSEQVMESFLKMNDAVQMYRPIRAYPWPIDIFTFQSTHKNDISITFFNCLENINTNLAYTIEVICDLFFNEGYFTQNSELIPLVILLTFGIMSKDLDRYKIYDKLLPELAEKTNIKEFLFEKIQSMCNPYYKSRALYQLAQFYDEKSYHLLNQSFILTKQIQESVMKFQVLEKIFSILHYKALEHEVFIQQIVDELILTYNSIEGVYNRIIASIRLSFYRSGDFRIKYLTNALEALNQMDEDHIKMKLIVKLKPLICLYDELQIKLNKIIENLKNPIHNYFVNSYYGRILFTENISFDISNLKNFENENNNENNENIPNYNELQSLFLLFAQLNDMKLVRNKTDNIDQLWINLFKDINNQSNIQKILEIGLKNELFLTPQVAIIFDELIQKGKEDVISILFPYIIKPSNEVLPIVYRWFKDNNNKSIQKLATLLLSEAKYIFESAVDILIDLLKSDNDQMRYRAQRIFQHPERDVKEPTKRISVIGKKTLLKILQTASKKEHLPRVLTYLGTFFFDVLWDDPEIFQNIRENIAKLEEGNPHGIRRMWFFNKIKFINSDTWNAIMQSLKLELISHPTYIEGILHSTIGLTQYHQITEDNWTEFARILSVIDTSQFREQKYFVSIDAETIEFILNEVCTLTNINDESYFQIFESKIINALTIKIEDLSQRGYIEINHIRVCNFHASQNLNETILNMLNNISLNIIIMENLIKFLIQTMKNFNGIDDTIFVLIMCDCLLCLVVACVQKEDYLYRKITNSSNFNKAQLIKLLEKMINKHPYFVARGSAFILLSAMDHSNSKVLLNAMNTLFDENLVKEYSMIGIPLIHLSPNVFLDDLLESIKDDSAIKTYDLLKIFTDFALNEKLNPNSKSKIINYLTNEIGKLKSKKPVNYYYTDIQIPFTTTLENQLYKSWIKIQGLSGKTQYSINTEKSTI